MAGIGFNSGYSPYTGAGNLASVYGASPTFGSGYTGGYGSGGYQYPNNVGGVNYSSSAPSGYAWGPNGLVPIGQGAAGIQAYNPAIATSPTRSFEQPTFTNSMSNWLGGSGADVANSVYADMPSPYATEMASTGGSPYPGFTQNSQGEWVADSSSGGGGAGVALRRRLGQRCKSDDRQHLGPPGHRIQYGSWAEWGSVNKSRA